MQKKQRKTISGITLTLLLIGILTLAFNVEPTKSSSWAPPPVEWSKTYGAWIAHSVVQTNDGGYALTGIDGTGLGDFRLVKTDSNGNMQWSQTYGGTPEERALSVVQTNDGGYALAGMTQYYPGWQVADLWLIKTDSFGNMQWNKTYGGDRDDRGGFVIQTNDGGYALIGTTYSYGDGHGDFWLIKTDPSGNTQWTKTYGAGSTELAYSGIQTDDGGYALIGAFYDWRVGTFDFWLVKTDLSGNKQWAKTYGGAGSDYGDSVIQTNDGGYVIAGTTESYGAGGSDFWLIKTDPSGNTQWTKTYGGNSGDSMGFPHSLVQTNDGGYALIGATASYGAGASDMWLVKTDSNGNMQWSQTYGTAGDDLGYSILQTIDGGYALAGTNSGDFWLVKLGLPIERTPVYLDIKPGSWPNPLNLASQGVLAVAICGTADRDVTTINATTLKLTREGLNEGVPPIRWDYEDVATPWTGEPGGGHDLEGDGYFDLMLIFSRQEVRTTLGLDAFEGQAIPLIITGNLNEAAGGTPITGQDFVWVLNLPGDANDDGFVNSLDIGTINAHWSPSGGAPSWSLGYSFEVDCNSDGFINSLDIGVVNANWGRH